MSVLTVSHSTKRYTVIVHPDAHLAVKQIPIYSPPRLVSSFSSAAEVGAEMTCLAQTSSAQRFGPTCRAHHDFNRLFARKQEGGTRPRVVSWGLPRTQEMDV